MPSAVSSSTVNLIRDMLKDSKMSARVQQRFLSQVETTGKLPPVVDKQPTVVSGKKKEIKRVPVTDRPQVRLKHQITIEEVEKYTGPSRPLKDSAVEKQKFIDWLEGTDKIVSSIRRNHQDYYDFADDDDDEVDEFKMLIEEIRDRQEWIRDMHDLGQADQFKSRIDFEIKSRIKRLHELEKKRSSTIALDN